METAKGKMGILIAIAVTALAICVIPVTDGSTALFMLISLLAFVVLLHEAYSRIKYSSRAVYHEKLERLQEVQETIGDIKEYSGQAEAAINELPTDMDFTWEFAEALLAWRDNESLLEGLEKEEQELEAYLRIAGRYVVM